MPLLKPKDLRKLSVEELKKRLSELRLELMKERGNIRVRRISKQTKKVRNLRKNIARILTILNEKLKG